MIVYIHINYVLENQHIFKWKTFWLLHLFVLILTSIVIGMQVLHTFDMFLSRIILLRKIKKQFS